VSTQITSRHRSTSIAAAALAIATVAPLTHAVVSPESTADAEAVTNSNPADPKWAAPAGTIDADAIKNGYVNSATDLTNAANLLSGRVGVMETTAPSSISDTMGLNGVTVFMQFRDKDGTLSPVYAAQSQKLAGQAAGAYAFDLRMRDAKGNLVKDKKGNYVSFYDANGKPHLFDASGVGNGQQAYRLWVAEKDLVNPETGNPYVYTRQSGGIVPNSWVGVAPGSGQYPADASGMFQLAGTNMQRTGIFLTEAVDPAKNYMSAPNVKVDPLGPLSNPATTLSVTDTISGFVWQDTLKGDRQVGPPTRNTGDGDTNLEGYNVFASVLTPDAQKRVEAIENDSKITQAQRAGAIQAMLKDMRAAGTEPIAVTVTGKTDANGQYTLRTGYKDLTGNSRMYMWVTDPNGQQVNAYSPFPTPVFQKYNDNASEAPHPAAAIVPGMNPAPDNFYNFGFAVLPYGPVKLDIPNYDQLLNPAPLGGTAKLNVTGTLPPIQGNRIVWRNETTGKVVKECPVSSLADANACTFPVSSDPSAAAGTVYSATLYSGVDDLLASDSFIVAQGQNAVSQPAYTAKETFPGSAVTLNQTDTSVPAGTKFTYGTPVDASGNPVSGWTTQPASDAGTGGFTATPPAGAKPGEYKIPVQVVYPDGSQETVYAAVTVKPTPQADTFTPQGQTTEAVVGTSVPEARSAIANVADLPGDATYTWEEAPSTDKVGDVPAVVVVTYPDGSVDRVPVTVRITPAPTKPLNQTNDPAGQDQTVNLGDTPVARASIANADDMPAGTFYRFESPVDTSTSGDKQAYVIVTYPDDTVDRVPVTVHVRSQAEQFDPSGTQQTVDNGAEVDPEASISNAGDLPEGTTFEFEKAPDTTTPGTKDAVVVVTYPDGSVDKVPVKVTVTAQNEQYDPQPAVQVVDQNTELDPALSLLPNQQLPDGTRIEWATTPDTSTPGTKDGVVRVTYPDGTTDEVKVQVEVRTQADQYAPAAKTQTVDNGATPKAEDSIADAGSLPEGTKIAWESAPDTSSPGSKDAVVVVTYPDGSTEKIPVSVVVRTQADALNPEGQDRTVDNGGTLDPKDSITNAGDLPEGTKFTFETQPSTDKPGTYTTNVIVTYPDGSVDTVPVKVTVRPLSDTTDPKGADITVDNGQAVTPEDVLTNEADLPEGTTLALENPVDTSKPGQQQVTVVVTYPDGSTEKVTKTVTVRPQSDTNTPEGQTIDVVEGAEAYPESAITNIGDLPAGTTFTWATEPDTSSSGTQDAVVRVTYPDGSTEDIPVQVNVTPKPAEPMNTTNEPTGQDVTVKAQDALDARAAVANADSLPAGTHFEFVDPPSTDTPGTFDNVEVRVVYPDDTVDTITVTVTVTPLADDYAPTAADQTVDNGATPDAAASIGNLADLPAGTKVEWDSAPDTSTPGDKPGKVKVTYPDGSTDTVDVTVTVRPQADTLTPAPKVRTVENGAKDLRPEDSIANTDELPGATYTWETQPDTTKPGVQDVAITVTYPDGSSEVVATQIVVSSIADANEPKAQPQTVNRDAAVDPKASISNAGDLPEGTTFAFESPVDTSTSGTKDAVVLVTYPDGSVDRVAVKVSVRTDEQYYAPAGRTQTVNIGDEPTPAASIVHPDSLPVGTKLTWETAPDTSSAGVKDAVVRVEYPDGTSETVNVSVNVRSNEQQYTPHAGLQVVDKGAEPAAADSVDNAGELPEGTEITWVTAPDTSSPGQKTGEVQVTYPDGTSETLPVVVQVRDDAAMHEPTATDQVVNQGDSADPRNSLTGDLPEGTNLSWEQPVDTSTSGVKDAVVVVTYPDGSVDRVPAKVIVRTHTDQYDAAGQDITAVEGVDAPPARTAIANVADLPTDATYTWSVAPDTSATGDVPAVVLVTYPDGTVDRVPVTVHVVAAPKTPMNEEHTPKPAEQTVNVGDSVVPRTSVDNVSDLPAGSYFEFEQPVDTSTPGSKDATVMVTYPDGTTDKVDVTVVVRSQADQFTPEGQPQSTNHGQVPAATGSIVNAAELPAGTTVTWKTEPDVSAPGTKDAEVLVTYPDGSSETVKVKVDVREQSQQFNPQGQDQSVKEGEAPEASGSIANPELLPEGTDITWESAPDTSTPGVKDATVVVTYPDGTTDKVNVKVTVGSMADQHDPVGQDQTVNSGDVPQAGNSVANLSDLPAGTTTGWESAPDTSTPGAKDATVVVTYPDGSTDTVDVTVDVASQAEQQDPQGQGIQAVVDTPAPNAATAIENASDLPAGTTITWDEEPDTSKPGTVPATVVVTYPDKTEDRVPVEVTVVEAPATPMNESYQPDTRPVFTKQFVDAPAAATAVVNADTFPPGTHIEWTAEPDTSVPGEQTVSITVTYPDGTEDVVETTLTVGQSLATTHTPFWDQTHAQPGARVTLPQVGDRSLPAGTTFTVDNPAFVIADDGTAYFTVPADAKPGDVFTTTVTIRYPDGSYETEEIRVTAGMAYNPSYGDPVAAALGGSGTALLTFEVVPDVSEAHITAAHDHNGLWHISDPDAHGNITAVGPTLETLAKMYTGKESIAELASLFDASADVTVTYRPGVPADEDVTARFTLVAVDGTPMSQVSDWDGDGVSNEDEVAKGSNPFDPASVPAGTDTEPEQPEPEQPNGGYPPEVTVTPGGSTEVPAPTLPDDTTVTPAPDTPDWVEVKPDGTVVITPPEDTTPGTYPVEVEITRPDKDPTKATIDVTVTEGTDAEPEQPEPEQPNGGYPPEITVTPGGSTEVPAPTLPDDTTVTPAPDTPDWVEVKPDGTVVITPPEDTTPGTYPVEVEITRPDKDPTKATIEVTVTDGTGSTTETPAPSGSSELTEEERGRCIATGVGFGLPLLALIPIAIGTHVHLPWVDEMSQQVNAALRDANTQLQQKMGVYNQDVVNQVESINRQLQEFGREYGTVIGGVSAVAVVVLASALLWENCTPGEQLSSESSSK